MKVFAAGISTETNTFCASPTRLDDFAIARGSDPPGTRDAGLDLEELWRPQAAEHECELVFSLNAFAQPAGITVRAAYESLRGELLNDLRAAMPVDVVLLMLHGAMVAEGYEDCEQDVIERVREMVGPAAVIGVELDLHCHLSERKIGSADVVITYKEYPHVDVNDRARDLFELAMATRLARIRPVMALFDCCMVGMYPTSRQPLRAFVELMAETERRPGVLAVSFGHGFQFADVPHLGAKMLVITDGDSNLAHSLAGELGARVYALRHEIGFETVSMPMQHALREALSTAQRPVVVADQSDNVGGGAPGDSTFVLRWLLDNGIDDVGMAIMHDPEVVARAKATGSGATLRVLLGGKMGEFSGEPVDAEVKVLSVRTDYFHGLPQQSGKQLLFPVGDVAAVRCRGIDIVVGSRRCQCLSPTIFSDLGIDPWHKRLLIAKSYQHFHAAFAPLAGRIIYMTAPGAVPPDPRQVPYRRLNTSRLYPWVDDPLRNDLRGNHDWYDFGTRIDGSDR